ncbi:hypothetical protein BLA29_000530, partial [Euroglyphus maynei]
MIKLLFLTVTVAQFSLTFIECHGPIPRMQQFGSRIPRAPRLLPPFMPTHLMSQASHPMPQPLHSMPFLMKGAPQPMDMYSHSLIRPPHHPRFSPMHHTQASHPKPSYHGKPPFYYGKTDDCPFPSCELESAYNGEPAFPHPFHDDQSPMLPSLTSHDSGPLDLPPRPPHEQYGFRQSMPPLAKPQQQVRVVYKPVVKLVKVPFPIKVIQREKIMFPIAVPFSQVLPLGAL